MPLYRTIGEQYPGTHIFMEQLWSVTQLRVGLKRTDDIFGPCDFQIVPAILVSPGVCSVTRSRRAAALGAECRSYLNNHTWKGACSTS